MPNILSSEGKRDLITVVIILNEGKMPVVGPIGVAPTLKDGGTCLIVGLDIVLGEGDGEVSVAKWGIADQGTGD
jgi:hypothetical protein